MAKILNPINTEAIDKQIFFTRSKSGPLSGAYNINRVRIENDVDCS